MAFLVEQQDEPLAAIETTAVDVEKNAEEGYAHFFPLYTVTYSHPAVSLKETTRAVSIGTSIIF